MTTKVLHSLFPVTAYVTVARDDPGDPAVVLQAAHTVDEAADDVGLQANEEVEVGIYTLTAVRKLRRRTTLE
jgi:hypothetical protein